MALIVPNIPLPSLRITPDGVSLDEGYQSKVTFSANQKVILWEISMKPPGLIGGKEINKTSQLNKTFKTKALPKLIDVSPGHGEFEYNSLSYADIWSVLLVNNTITTQMPDGYFLCAFGWLSSFDPENLEHEKMPKAKCEFHYSNIDPLTGQEAGIALYAPDGITLVAFATPGQGLQPAGIGAFGNIG